MFGGRVVALVSAVAIVGFVCFKYFQERLGVGGVSCLCHTYAVDFFSVAYLHEGHCFFCAEAEKSPKSIGEMELYLSFELLPVAFNAVAQAGWQSVLAEAPADGIRQIRKTIHPMICHMS